VGGRSIAPENGCVPQTLLEWVKRQEVDSGMRNGVTLAEAQRVKQLEREVKELRRANETLKWASAFYAQAELDRRLKYLWISSTSAETCTGSIRSARCCRLPRRGIDAMRRFGATHSVAARLVKEIVSQMCPLSCDPIRHDIEHSLTST